METWPQEEPEEPEQKAAKQVEDEEVWSRHFLLGKKPELLSLLEDKVADFVPHTFSETQPQMVPMDLNIAFQGLALIQGQIYNPGSSADFFWPPKKEEALSHLDLFMFSWRFFYGFYWIMGKKTMKLLFRKKHGTFSRHLKANPGFAMNVPFLWWFLRKHHPERGLIEIWKANHPPIYLCWWS